MTGAVRVFVGVRSRATIGAVMAAAATGVESRRMNLDAPAQPDRPSRAASAEPRHPAQAPPGWVAVVSATGRPAASSRPISLRRLVAMLTTAGVLLLCLVAVAGSLLSRQIAGSQAVREVAQTTDLLAESVLQPSLTNPMATTTASGSIRRADRLSTWA